MADGFIFYESFYKAIQHLQTGEEKLAAYEAICGYAIMGIDAEISGYPAAVYEMAKPQIDANLKRRVNGAKGREYGKLGGRPAKNNPIGDIKKTPEGFLRETTDGLLEETAKVKDKVKVKEKVKDKEKEKVKEKKIAHGEFGHVMLTNAEYDRLVRDYGKIDTDDTISWLDAYIEEKHYKSSSHNLAIRRWAHTAMLEARAKEQKAKQTSSPAQGRSQNEFDSWAEALKEVESEQSGNDQGFDVDAGGVSEFQDSGQGDRYSYVGGNAVGFNVRAG